MAGSLGIAGQSVSGTPGAAKTAGVGWDDVADMPGDEVYALLFPGRGEREGVCGRPDWAGVRRELARVGVTLRILHGRTSRAKSPTTPAASGAAVTVPAGCAAATTTRTWAGDR